MTSTISLHELVCMLMLVALWVCKPGQWSLWYMRNKIIAKLRILPPHFHDTRFRPFYL
jgi:hypothetical protein